MSTPTSPTPRADNAALPDTYSPTWQAAVDVVRDFPATAELPWDEQNELAQRVVDVVAGELDELEASLDELVEAWGMALGRTWPPPAYLLDAAPKWVLERLGYAPAPAVA